MVHMMPVPMQPQPMASNAVMPQQMHMPAPTLQPSAQDQAQKELIAYLQKRSADLPPDIQQRVHNTCRKEGKRVIKDLETAAKALGEARTVYEEALLARSQHINTWKVFLAEAVKNWSDYGKLFAQHEEALQARIAMAKEQFQDAKDCMEASNISVGKVVVQELSDEEDLPGDAGDSAMQITESIQSLSTSLQQLSKATESIQIEEKVAKRPRLDASKSEAEAASHFS